VNTVVAAAVVAAGMSVGTSAYATGNTGALEICKTASGSGVTGDFEFTVAGVPGTTKVPVGGCSQAITVTAGDVVVTELARAGFVVAGITATPAGRLVSMDLTARTAKVKVTPGTRDQTIVTFSNKVQPPKTGVVKVCKKAGPGVSVGQEFTFTVGTTTTTAKAGSCSLPITLPVGNVTIREQVAASYEVTAIEVTGAGSLVSRDLTTATAVVGVAAGVTDVTYTNKKKNRPPVCTTVKASPGEIWPPNHKFVTVTLSGATDPDGDATTLRISGVTQDEALNGTGDGDTAPDAARVSGRSDQVQVRAERSGQGDGRVYRISFTASDGVESCTGTVSVGVPHDRSGGGAVDTTSVIVNSFGP